MNGFPGNMKPVWRVAATVLASVLLTATSALGGGGFPEISAQLAVPGFSAQASDSKTTAYSSQGGQYSSTGFANASAQGGSESRHVEIGTGHETTVQDVKTGISIASDTETIVFQKGGNLLGKSKTETITKINVDGRTYTVADEVALAAARATQFGATAAASVESSGGGFGNGYSGAPVAAGKAAAAR